MQQNACGICKIACLLVVIGAVNWGFVGLGELLGGNGNLVHAILGSWPTLESILYVLIGVSGIGAIFSKKCPCKRR